MTNWNIAEHSVLLKTMFSGYTSSSPTHISFRKFTQKTQDIDHKLGSSSFITDFCPIPDSEIAENRSFYYPIFHREETVKADSCIILLHGLNERSWEKYLTWADYLADFTGKPVIMFPIAFHINRTPPEWYNPRTIMQWVQIRNKRLGNPNNLTFANLALSDRLSNDPLRFYTSGRETGINILQLITEIQSGNYPFVNAGAQVDFFAYSIGALLAQVLLLSNPQNRFDTTKLFMFCGGSVLNQTNGNSRYIMDKESFELMLNFYQNDFLTQPAKPDDCFNRAFRSMIDAKEDTTYRENFFKSASNRIKAISLKKDTVIPTSGIQSALGSDCAKNCLTELDFSFDYSHEIPFPIGKNMPPETNQMFNHVFFEAGSFLA